ncbi:TPA: HigA family addiction module antidote protein [Citrobacter freundii]|nr:HigA family addiction module antidote protein [Citrobacter freundii]HAT3963867.1 HigA family addiction module antidote protein [Citrobacter freundii]
MSNKPMHPGKYLADLIKRIGCTPRFFALTLGVNPSTLQRIINCQSAISPEMAIRLEKVTGMDAHFYMGMQTAYDLEKAREQVDVTKLERLTVA